MSGARLWPSPWPAEDGGPERRQEPSTLGGLGIRAGERLELTAQRDAYATTMVVLRDPGEVFLLRHTLGTRPLAGGTICWVERIDPRSLAPIARSPTLSGGPFWPGGLAAHANGALYVVYGRHCHRLSSSLELLGTARLPSPRPHNSFVVLGDGTLAIKDLDLGLSSPALLSVLDPETLAPAAAPLVLPEPSIARLSADGNTIYVVGISTVWRVHWDGRSLNLDDGWRPAYLDEPGHSYGWDAVIAGGQLWLLDNGAHDFVTTMRGAGRSPAPIRLLRVSLADHADREPVEVSGLPRGTATNPPLYDAARRIAVAYDSGNGVVRALRFDEARRALTPLWERELDHAAHMISFPDTGELVLQDFRGPVVARTATARALGRRSSRPAQFATVRRALARSAGDDVVVVDIETGAERARAHVPSMFQSVVFPAPGFDRDLYWCTFSTVARLAVTV